MKSSTDDLLHARDQVVAEVYKLLSESNEPVVVAIDGGSGVGKSALADQIREVIDAVVVPLDDFYAADIPDPQWREFSAKEKFENVFQWERVQKEALQPLKQRNRASWYAFDFNSPMPDGTYQLEEKLTVREPVDVILLEGAYSASPQLLDLVDLTVLVDVPVRERHARLAKRQDKEFSEYWHSIWDEAEQYYFGEVRPKNAFDLVVCL